MIARRLAPSLRNCLRGLGFIAAAGCPQSAGASRAVMCRNSDRPMILISRRLLRTGWVRCRWVTFRVSTYTTPALPVAICSVTNSRGSVTLPLSALAATVNGLAR